MPDKNRSAASAPVALSATQIISHLALSGGWKLHGDGDSVAIEKTFEFKNYLSAVAFANAVAYVAERQNHHPDMLVQFMRCSVRFNTHDVKGITITDFECAKLVDALCATQ